MNIRFHTLKLSSLLLAAGLVSGQAMAQTNTNTGTADTSATVVKPIALTKTADLSFGRLASVEGTVSIAADTGIRSSATTAMLVEGAGANNAKGRAAFTVAGESSLAYSISAPAETIVLASGSNNLTVTLTGVHSLNDSATGPVNDVFSGTLDADGNDILGIGGSIDLTDTTPSGLYANTAGIILTVDYN